MSSMQKFGDWDLVLNLANNMSADVRNANKIVLAQLALRAEAMAVKFIRDQSLPWRKLSAQYLARKQRAGLSYKIYVATSQLFQNITSTVDSQATKSFAGIFRKVKNKEGQYVADIAKILEYGSIKRNIPPRKLWSVVFREMRKHLIREQMFAAQTVREWKKRTGGKG
jgi:hypothetical protein